jgi:hypothetical protein
MAKFSDRRLASSHGIRRAVSFHHAGGGTPLPAQCRQTEAASTPRIERRKMISGSALVWFKPKTFHKLRETLPAFRPGLQLKPINRNQGTSVQAAVPSRLIGRSRVDAQHGRIYAIRLCQKRWEHGRHVGNIV